jgi:hypothetical protein
MTRADHSIQANAGRETPEFGGLMRRLPLMLLALAGLSACDSAAPPAPEPTASAGPEYHQVADVKQLMNWILDPSSDVIWEAVGTIVTEEGEQNLAPETDEQWTAIRDSAAMIAEAGNLLLMPGRARDQGDWAKHAHDMTKAAQAAMAAAEAKDTESLFTAGGDIYLVCTACHEQYALELKKVN